MPVFIYEKDAFEKMCRVEGEGWKEQEERGWFGNNSFHVFLKKWSVLPKSFKKANPDDCMNVNDANNFYGYGGRNRYIVRYSGEILLIKGSARTPLAIKKARAEGFRIFGEKKAQKTRKGIITK